jgi:hypothetical protein
MTTAGRQGAIRHTEALAWVEEGFTVVEAEDFTAAVAEDLAVAGVGNRSFVAVRIDREI